jgi:TPR repeat protein
MNDERERELTRVVREDSSLVIFQTRSEIVARGRKDAAALPVQSLDDAEAAGRVRKEAEKGDCESQFVLATMYEYGDCVRQDYAEAEHWYRKAADQGFAPAQFNLAALYRTRRIPQGYAEAAKWYREAANQSDDYAQYWLGEFYAAGQGVPQDDAEAMRLYLESAEQGNPLAQCELADRYAHGKGVATDYVRAFMWANLAAPRTRGDKQVQLSNNRDWIAAKMTPQQIAEAQRLASDWNRRHGKLDSR